MLVLTLAMLAYCTLVIVLQCRRDQPSYLDWAIAGYLLVGTASLLLWPGPAPEFLHHHGVTGTYAALFAAAFLPPLLGMEPFTCHYARKTTPQEAWNSPLFVRINRLMTSVWSGIFAICMLLSLHPSMLMQVVVPAALILGFGFPFNSRFPDFYLRRRGIPSLGQQRRMAERGREAKSASPATIEESLPEEPQQSLAEIATEITKPHPFPRKEHQMKVLALNSSPRGDGQSKTELLMNHLVAGMREAGADVEVVELRHKTINNCIGCFACWTKTPGACIQKDDMSRELYPKWLTADLAVYGSPLYHFTVNAAMKAFIERTLPVLEPFFKEYGGRTTHPLRTSHPGIVMLSVAGFPEDSVFEQLSSWSRFVFGKGLVAEIYRPAAEMLRSPVFAEAAGQILSAVTEAGRELVADRKISAETLARIRQPLFADNREFFEMGNLMWKTCIAEGVTPKEMAAKGIVPRPDSIESFMLVLARGFNPVAAGDTRAVIQFDFSGAVAGSCHFQIENGKIKPSPGPAEKPTLTIQAPFDVWMDITTGKEDGQAMFMQQKFQFQGDLSLLMRLSQLFGR